MQPLFDLAFARLERASSKRVEFGTEWADYIAEHPWDIDLSVISDTEFEFFAIQRSPAPAALSLIFGEWLATIRSSLDNGLYAWVAAVTKQNPPPQADRLQYPICSTPAEFKKQRSRYSAVPSEVIDALEMAQPYQSPFGAESNLFYWVNELARTDRHRTPHIGIGRVAEHSVRIGVPEGITIKFDSSLSPWQAIDDQVTICRFTTSAPVARSELRGDFRGVGIDPEIRAWATFTMDGTRTSLQDRMIYTELFSRGYLESMAAYSQCAPRDGFRMIDPNEQLAPRATPQP